LPDFAHLDCTSQQALTSALTEVHLHSQEYLNTKQAAELYGLSESWLTKLRVFGGGSPHLKVRRRVLYERSEFERWLDSHRRLTTSDRHAA
jgi:helix-turn-helix protein